MDLQKIINKLESLEYVTKQFSSHLNEVIIGRDLGGSSALGGTNIDASCTLSNSHNSIKIMYGYANIQEEQTFNSTSELISFIQKKFPL